VPALDGLSPAQRAAASHAEGPLLIVGGAGSGKTRTLAARFAWLVEQGEAPEAILVLTLTERAADALRRQVEDLIARPYEELAVMTLHALCARLLREQAREGGIDPFAVAVGRADRLAMLLERIDELTIRRHDFRGNPAALLMSFVRRIDRLKEELIGPEDYAAWAEGLVGSADEEADDAARARAAREREFAEVYRAHDRMLAEQGALDSGDLVIGALRLLREHPHVRAGIAARYRHLLVDDVQEPNFAQGLLLRLLAAEHGNLVAAGDDDQAIRRLRAAAAKNLRDLQAELPGATVVQLEHSFRCPQRVLDAAGAVVAPLEDRLEKRLAAADGLPTGEVAFWRAANERAQAQSVAADVERLVGREGVPPEAIAVLVRSIAREGQAVAVALEERAVPHRLVGEAAFFQRAEVRDLLAWLRLLIDPGDAPAVVRALARPPVELREVDLARCTQIARRRKLDMVAALAAALESPQIPPEARDRVRAFLTLYRSASAALDTTRPDLFVHRLIERLGLRRQQLFTAQAEVVERLRGLARFGELAAAFVQRQPQATTREFARSIAAAAEAGLREEDEPPPPGGARGVQVLAMHASQGLEFEHVYVLGLHAARMPGAHTRTLEPIAPSLMKETLPDDDHAAHVAEMRRLLHVAMTRARRRLVLVHPQASDRGAAQPPSPFAEEARAALGGVWEERAEELFGPAESLHSTYRILRDELLETIKRTGSRIGELRFDTDLDVSHAVVRYLEVVKLAALIERPEGQSVGEALAEVNARIAQAITAEQREIFASSTLDEYLLDTDRADRRRAQAIAAREEPTLEPFLPRKGDGLVLSASDIDTYRTCPLKYKFARVFRIPQEPTLNQRFGILVHQVLERFHGGSDPARAGASGSLEEMLGLLDAGWRRGGFGSSEQERQLRGKATAALTRYHERFQGEDAEPTYFERSFSFPIGRHLLRGRVDRVDRLPEGGWELIDYKTGPPKTASQLEHDVQLSLYAVAACEAWELDEARGAYYYVLDDAKVPIERHGADRGWIEEVATEVAEGILSQGFEPTPSFQACAMCDYRLVCPAAER
jgi:DNA helicase-2/ATP-dependent DNA helicase PcrA